MNQRYQNRVPSISSLEQVAESIITTKTTMILSSSSRSIVAKEKRKNPSTMSQTVCSSDTNKGSLVKSRLSRALRLKSKVCCYYSYYYYCATATCLLVILLLLLANKGECEENLAAAASIDDGKGIPQTKMSQSTSADYLPLKTDKSSFMKKPKIINQEEKLNLPKNNSEKKRIRFKRLAMLAPSMPTSSLLMLPINELRISGSKSEPPSRPSVDWSKQRPYFGTDMVRNVSVELGKTAYLTCKVFELGDKTVSWLRPRENEILTAGRYTYIGDSRFASINDNGSHDWILEIKDVGLNDSTSYECQVSTDPKMSAIINLQVKAAKAKIKQGEQFYAPLGSNIEFTCEIGHQKASYSLATSAASASATSTTPNVIQQTYWYYNGNLLNYAKAHNSLDKNFSIEWDSMTQTSRFRLFNIQLNDAGNYTCKPTSAEPATIRLHVKRFNKNNLKDRSHYGSGGYHSANTKEAQRTRQHFNLDSGNGLEIMADSGAGQQTKSLPNKFVWLIITSLTYLLSLLLIIC